MVTLSPIPAVEPTRAGLGRQHAPEKLGVTEKFDFRCRFRLDWFDLPVEGKTDALTIRKIKEKTCDF